MPRTLLGRVLCDILFIVFGVGLFFVYDWQAHPTIKTLGSGWSEEKASRAEQYVAAKVPQEEQPWSEPTLTAQFDEAWGGGK